MANEVTTPAPKEKAPAKVAESKYTYIGEPLRKGITLPNGRLIIPGQIADVDLEYWMEQYPELRGYFKAG